MTLPTLTKAQAAVLFRITEKGWGETLTAAEAATTMNTIYALQARGLVAESAYTEVGQPGPRHRFRWGISSDGRAALARQHADQKEDEQQGRTEAEGDQTRQDAGEDQQAAKQNRDTDGVECALPLSLIRPPAHHADWRRLSDRRRRGRRCD